MKILDFHAHCGAFNDRMFDKHRLFTAAGLDALASSSGVSGMAVSPLEGLAGENGLPGEKPLLDETRANEELLDRLAPYPKLIPFFACQPGMGNADSIRKLLKRHPGKARGLKFHPYHLNIPADDPAYTPYLAIAADFGLPCLFHTAPGASNPSAIYAQARKVPHAAVVLGHINMFGDYGEGIGTAERAAETGDANLFLEVSWAPASAIVEAVKRAGPDKVLFGTDAPFGKGGKEATPEIYAERIGEIRTAIRAAFGRDGDSILEAMFYRNAEKLLGIKQAE